jgi:hypothetical protein
MVNSLVSSANIATWLDVNASGRSLTYKTKRREPRIEPPSYWEAISFPEPAILGKETKALG